MDISQKLEGARRFLINLWDSFFFYGEVDGRIRISSREEPIPICGVSVRPEIVYQRARERMPYDPGYSAVLSMIQQKQRNSDELPRGVAGSLMPGMARRYYMERQLAGTIAHYLIDQSRSGGDE